MSIYDLFEDIGFTKPMFPPILKEVSKSPQSYLIDPVPMIVTAPHAHCLLKGKTHGEKRCDLIAKDSAKYLAGSLSNLNGLTDVKLFIGDKTRDLCKEEPCSIASNPEHFCDLNRLRCNDQPFRQSVRLFYRQIPPSILNKKTWLWDIHSFPGGKGHFEDKIQNVNPDVVFLDNLEASCYQSDTMSLALFLTNQGFRVNVFKGRYNNINDEGLRVYKIPHVFLVEFNESTPKLRRIAIIENIVLWVALHL